LAHLPFFTAAGAHNATPIAWIIYAPAAA